MFIHASTFFTPLSVRNIYVYLSLFTFVVLGTVRVHQEQLKLESYSCRLCVNICSANKAEPDSHHAVDDTLGLYHTHVFVLAS